MTDTFDSPNIFDSTNIFKEHLEQAKARIALKREISGATRADLEESDFVFPETRSFPIQKPQDIGAAVNAWGRATAVRARGFTFDDFKQRLIRLARRKGPSFVAALPADWEVEAKGVSGNPSNIYAHGPGGLFSPGGLGKRQKAATRIGRFLRERRLEVELSLPDLAKKMPISASTIGQIERGEIGVPSQPVLMAFAKALTIPKSRLDDLLKEGAMPRENIARNAITAGKQGLRHVKPPKAKPTRIGSFLRKRREELEMTLVDVAAKLPITASTVGDIESGEIATPSEPVMRAFAKALKLPLQDIKAKLPQKAMPLEHIAPQRGKSFRVFKDAAGRYRWIMVSSSAYQDRDREIVSLKSLRQAVKEHDALEERGPLLWWHLPIKLGETDFGMVYKRMLVESGSFINEAVGSAVHKKAVTLGGSIGFKHPKNEPDLKGVFNNISIFERSLLPQNKASNFFTSLMVKENNDMGTKEKVEELVQLVGGAAEVARLLGEISATDKQAQQAGFTYKSQDDLESMTGDEFIEYGLQLKEHEEAEFAQVEAEAAAAEATKAAKAEHEGGEGPKDIMGLLSRIMAMLEKHDQAIKGLMEAMAKAGDGQKQEAEEESEVVALMNRVKGMLEQHGQAIKALTEKETAKQTSEQIIAERMAALESEQPPAVQNGYRASQKGPVAENEPGAEPVDPETAILERVKEKQPETEPFLKGASEFTKGLPGYDSHWGQAPPGQPGQPDQPGNTTPLAPAK